MTTTTRFPEAASVSPETVADAIAGDRAAFATIYLTHRPTIKRIVAGRMRGPSRTHIDDIVADVFLRAWVKIRSFQQRDASDIAAWLCIIAINRVRDFYKSAQHRNEHTDLIDDMDPDPDPGPDEVVADRDELDYLTQRVRARIAQLTPDQQRCLLLRVGKDMPTRETARRLARDVSATKGLHYRAKQRLRTLLAPDIAIDAAGIVRMKGNQKKTPQ